ncbi:bifunctional diaminohydroxyphosphoribosylaminopyrimidine deaminase/5-amino-6-(5-phosphoribosylamino)uracil reductase RibD [Bacillus solimangrovi]|uniref:Riboflavin biosynthesis protein RibD n=1 Tax=Bacillus solimangrovi TaxID=1305675 RepID=A0A1E5LHT9_9BACI|nr:bifunctional diaminohydroxyphosphoribosylaminopyrimidine deaminase/5-amino-6-(5-phosphoribosylamino)uracil reductase RibD [Bacillus solimangrovi]OEH93654.1 riboflavin biosynthesis protein RibD [Bacillus solimangrovi]
MSDESYMKLAIQLAQQTKGQTSPNPVVGAIVVKDHEVVGVGAHLKAGEAHAEVHALQMAAEKAVDATLYVTLEPCSHYGKTPPCADVVIEHDVRRVVIATTDPNPQVSGKGINKLKEADIEVKVGVLQEEASRLNEKFFHYIRTKTPYVTLKTAVSLDGKTATSQGDSKWITGQEARMDVHRYRHEHDAILVGIGTVLQDNPSLTTRLPDGGRNCIRIILDHHLRIPLDAQIVNDNEAPTWVVTTESVPAAKVRELENKGVRVIKLARDIISIEELLIRLGEEEITSLFVEGGATVHGSFLTAGAFQKVITYVAPKLIGGKEAPSSFLGEGIPFIDKAMSVDIQSFEKIGEDLKVVAVHKG